MNKKSTLKGLGKGLGKGLQALIPDIQDSTTNKEDNVQVLNINKIIPNEKQPRTYFDEVKLQELADSIKEHGIVQPIVVRPIGDKFEIVAGERRWRASKKVGLEDVPVIIKNLDDHQVTEIALIENIQREDLNPIEEALTYQRLINEFGLTQEKLAQRVSKSRSLIANMMRLLQLETSVQQLLMEKTLSIGHVRPLLTLEKKKQKEISKIIIEKGLSVRQTEEFIKTIGKEPKVRPEKPARDVIFMQFEEKLRGHFGTKVKISNNGKKGKIEIDYYNDEDLQRIIETLFPEESF